MRECFALLSAFGELSSERASMRGEQISCILVDGTVMQRPLKAYGVGEDGKAGVVVGVTSDLTSRFSAVDLVKIASEALGGKGGGGRPDMAQAGGPDGAKADAALKAIEAAMGA